MPEVLTMIQTEKNTPAPAVLFVVSCRHYVIKRMSFRQNIGSNFNILSGTVVTPLLDFFQYRGAYQLCRIRHLGA